MPNLLNNERLKLAAVMAGACILAAIGFALLVRMIIAIYDAFMLLMKGR